MDERPKQLVKQARAPLRCRKGQPARYDYEYERNDTTNVFVFVEPLRGWRRVEVIQRRTAMDWAQQLKHMIDVDYPKAQRTTLVMDNLNRHKSANLYEAFAPIEARWLIEKLEIVYTPKHGSWLNVAEIELAALDKQSTGGRVPDLPALACRATRLSGDRNNAKTRINWQFTTADARIKLRGLNPKIQS